MPENGISSPPYPTPVVTVSGLYRQLQVLREWANIERAELQGHGSDLDTDLPALATQSIWENVSVADHYRIWSCLRGIREYYDNLLRVFEDDWEQPRAIKGRLAVITAVNMVLANAFISPEQRELVTEQLTLKAEQQEKQLDRALQKLMREAGAEPLDDVEDI